MGPGQAMSGSNCGDYSVLGEMVIAVAGPLLDFNLLDTTRKPSLTDGLKMELLHY